MWKLFLGFVIFAAAAMFVIMKGGDNLDVGGEKHGSEAVHAPDAKPAAVAAPVATSAAAAAAEAVAAASAPAPAAASAAK
jgi:hypothetical protein